MLTVDFPLLRGQEFVDGFLFVIVLIVILFAFLFVITSFVIAKRYDLRCKGGACFWYGWFSENLMPHFGNLLFIPVLLNLFVIFQCTRFIEEGTFIETHCEDFCWGSTHFTWVVFTAIAAISYTAASVATRPFW
jgi:hypothetical protein